MFQPIFLAKISVIGRYFVIVSKNEIQTLVNTKLISTLRNEIYICTNFVTQNETEITTTDNLAVKRD